MNAISFSEHQVPGEHPSAPTEEGRSSHASSNAYENGNSSLPASGVPGDPSGDSRDPSEGARDPPGRWPRARPLHRHAVLEADVTNRTDLALQARPLDAR